MIPERWQRIKSLLESALEREPHARAIFLKEACSDDPALQSEVESLIASHEQAGGFIESPAFELMAESLGQSQSIVGSDLGPYRVTGRLGSGGMGEVYLAEDMRLGRKVALKVLLAHFTRDEERVRRFQQEARAASALNHPNIVTIHEIGEVTSRHFIVTEVIEGETLRRHLENAEIELTEALDIAIQIGSALSAAHAAGIVHRDIKPDNVMIRADGIVKVLDFGLAKLTELKSGEFQAATLINTQEGLVMGTAHYMSPEQARGFLVDARTDIWSLGVVLYEMIASRVPFDGETGSDVMAAILGREPITLARHKPEVPTELEWIVKKALRKDREERYQTAKELLTDLKNLKHRLEFEAEVARSESGEAVAVATAGSQEAKSTNEQSSKPATFVTSYHPVRRKRGKTLGVAIAIIVGFLAMSYLLLIAGRKRKDAATSQTNAGFTQLTDQAGAEFFPSLSPDGQSVVYASRATRNWDIYLQQVGSRNSINLTKDSPADDTQPAFSPDGRRIAFRSERDGGGIYVMGPAGESVTRLSNFGYSPAWSPDGEQILFGTEKIPQPSTRPSKSQLWTINTRTNERRLISEGDALQPNCSPHGNRIAFWSRPSKAGQRESISTIPAAGGDAVAVTDGATTDLNPVWSPDGKFLYFSSNRGGSINIWRVAIDEKSGAVSGQPEAITTIGAATSALQLSFARDGRQLAYIAQEEIRNLRRISFDPASGKATGEPISITTGSMQLWFPDASPDGQWLTCYSMGNQRHIFIMRTDGSELRDLTDDSYRHSWPRWSPDGKRIAFSSRRSGNYELWAINRDGGGLQQLTSGHPSPGAHYNPWSPDGKHIAYSIHAPKNDCIMFEPDKAWTEQKLEYLPPLSDASLSFEAWSWSPDGKKLAGVRHLPSGVHSGIGVYDLESRNYTWFTDFGDWPLWFKDNRHLLFVSQGQILLFDTRSGKYQPVLTVTDQDVDIGSPALSPDNRTIYFTYVAAEADIWLMTLD